MRVVGDGVRWGARGPRDGDIAAPGSELLLDSPCCLGNDAELKISVNDNVLVLESYTNSRYIILDIG